MNKLIILVICALVGTVVAHRHHHRRHHDSRSWSGKGGRRGCGGGAGGEDENAGAGAGDGNADINLSINGGASAAGGLSGSSSQDANAAINLSLGGLTKGFSGLIGTDGKPSKSGSYKWSYSTSGGAADAGAVLGGLTGELNAGSSQDANAAIKLKLDGLMNGFAENKPGKSGSYKWSYSTSGGAADAGAGTVTGGASQDANAAIKLSLGELTNSLSEVNPAKSGGYKWSYSTSGGAADAAAKIGEITGGIKAGSSQDSNAAIKVSLDGLTNGFSGLIGADGKPSKSGSYKWSYSTSGGAADAAAKIGEITGGIKAGSTQEANAAVKVSLDGLTNGFSGLIGADGKPSKSGSYKWSYSTSGGAADAGAGAILGSSQDANSAIKLSLGGLTDRFGSFRGSGRQDAAAGINLNVAGVEANIGGHGHRRGHGHHSRHHGHRNGELKLNLGGLGAGLSLDGISGSASSSSYLTISGLQFVQIGVKYYWIDSTNKMNWYDAHHTCRSHNAQLVTIESDEEMKALDGYLSDFKKEGKRFWTAANDLGKEGEFKWVSNGQKINYSKWSNNQPDNAGGKENCVELWVRDDQYKMNDLPCNLSQHVICEADTSCMNTTK